MSSRIAHSVLAVDLRSRMELRNWCDQTIKEWSGYLRDAAGEQITRHEAVEVDAADIYRLIRDLEKLERELL